MPIQKPNLDQLSQINDAKIEGNGNLVFGAKLSLPRNFASLNLSRKLGLRSLDKVNNKLVKNH